ncbi:MAG: septum formation initiator family protein [Clostridia bacterium]|nr:septum formation initiator family protein [Clostridia bacterium]
MKIIKRNYKKLLALIVVGYTVYTIISQQKVLNQYNAQAVEITAQIEKEEKNKEELVKQKNEVNSLEFIEQTAREKLDMYYPNERVYLDSGM